MKLGDWLCLDRRRQRTPHQRRVAGVNYIPPLEKFAETLWLTMAEPKSDVFRTTPLAVQDEYELKSLR